MNKRKVSSIDFRSSFSRAELDAPATRAGMATFAPGGVRFNLGTATLRVEPTGTPYIRDSDAPCDLVGALDLDGQHYLIFKDSLADESVQAQLPKPCVTDLLTSRELQIAVLVSQGRVNKQIAYQLKLSEWTVSGYLRRIYDKLGVRTRAAMVARIAGCPLFDTHGAFDTGNPGEN